MVDDVTLWLDTVLGGMPGWINLRAIDPDQKRSPRSEMLRTVGEAEAWCKRWDGEGYNLYAGLARRGEALDKHGRIDASEKNLAGCRVLWADLDDGTREQQLDSIRQFPIQPTLVIDSGGGTHAIWQLDDPIECASDPESNLRLRRILRGIQVVIGGDRAVVDPSRVFRVAGTRNYPNARKRALGRTSRVSAILHHSPYTVVLDDFDDFETRGAAELKSGPVEVQGHGERVPPAVETMLTRVPRMRAVFLCEERLPNKSASDEDFAIAVGLLRQAPWLLTEDIAGALRYRRIALAHLVKGAQKASGYYHATVLNARKRLDAETTPPDFDLSRAKWFQHVLGRAMKPQAKPEIVYPKESRNPLTRIATGIAELDEKTGGGVYGFTVIPGDSGVGKSVLAYSIALEGIAAGWTVLYIAAEMEQSDYEERAARYYDSSVDDVRKRMPLIAHIADGLELESLLDLILTTPTDETERYLFVIDSITKAASYIDRGDGQYSLFDAMSQLVRLGEACVRNGERRISVVMTSELNRDREALGRRVTYAASLQINMMQEKEQPDLVQISIPKARYGAKQPAFGPYMHYWRRHRLGLIGSIKREELEKEETEEAIF